MEIISEMESGLHNSAIRQRFIFVGDLDQIPSWGQTASEMFDHTSGLGQLDNGISVKSFRVVKDSWTIDHSDQFFFAHKNFIGTQISIRASGNEFGTLSLLKIKKKIIILP